MCERFLVGAVGARVAVLAGATAAGVVAVAVAVSVSVAVVVVVRPCVG